MTDDAAQIVSLTVPEMRVRLYKMIRELSFSDDKEITLASGKKSRLYFNLKPTMLDGDGAYLIARLILHELEGTDVTCVGGMELGAVPIAAVVAAISPTVWSGRNLKAFFIRKKPKDHGTQQLIEGLPGDTQLKGLPIAVVEDVTTTGGSTLKAIDIIRKEGGVVKTVIPIVDREEGAAQSFESEGLAFNPLFRAREFTGR